MSFTKPRRISVSEVRPGDILLSSPEDTPNPDRDTVAAVDGALPLLIIDFVNGTSTAPITKNLGTFVVRPR